MDDHYSIIDRFAERTYPDDKGDDSVTYQEIAAVEEYTRQLFPVVMGPVFIGMVINWLISKIKRSDYARTPPIK